MSLKRLTSGAAVRSNPINLTVFQLDDLALGTQLAVLPGSPLTVGKELLIRVNPPANDVRYIPLNAVASPPGGAAQAPAATFPSAPSTYGPEAGQPNLANAFAPQNPDPSAPPASARHNKQQSAPPALVAQNLQVNAQQPSDPQNTPYTVPPAFEQQTTQPNKPSWFGQPNTPPIQPASYDPQYPQQQNPAGGARGAPQYLGPQQDNPNPPAANAGYRRRATGNSGAAVVPGYTDSPSTTSRSNQRQPALSDDPMWLEAEKFENAGDIDSAIRCYDEVGRTYGQIDPNLALRAMNRAQYLRNEVSAGVAPKGPLTRSAKPSFADTATTNVHPSFTGQPNVESLQRPNTRAQTEVYPEVTPQFLPADATAARQKALPQTNLVEEIAQPNAKLTKPLMANETVNKTAQRTWCAGHLEKTAMDYEGKRFYRLIPDDKKIASVIYCVNEPGINLDDAVNRHVQIYGPFYLHTKVNQYYMEVLQVNILP